MTLIVGRVNDGQAYMLGDTALTCSRGSNANPILQGCLKQYIVADTIAIGFAGNQPQFEEDVGRYLECSKVDEIVSIATESQRAGKDYELMVIEIGRPHLHMVKDGQVTESPAGFVGDPVAFKAFQAAFHARETSTEALEPNKATMQFLRLPEPAQGDLYSRLFDSLRSVIIDPKIPSVGGIVVPLCSDSGNFRYINYADVTSDPLYLEEWGPEPKPIRFGTDKGGGYAMEFGDDRPRGGTGRNIGIYFLQGGFGAAFPDTSSRLRSPHLVRAPNPAYWTLNTERLLGQGIASSFLTSDHCGFTGEELLQLERWQDADFVYQLRDNLSDFAERPELLERYVVGRCIAKFNNDKQILAITELAEFTKTHMPSALAQQHLERMLAARVG
ncbi:hypothetical protein [Burkholderia cenocepacia]|uniref:hypothetical protein n=1 Tax=Burkholderia cenocepacia TaxID=95486 RepID=UPI002AC359D4|nr:hypothetical protein [Burkholderia cenocepacia]